MSLVLEPMPVHATTIQEKASKLDDPRVSHEMIARRTFEISLIADATPEENAAKAEAQLRDELAAQAACD